MTGKERVLKALSFEPVDRTPWVPYAGVQAANLIGKDAEEYLKSEDNIVNGVLKAFEMYKPDGLPVAFDLQIEAEALGCDLKWSKQNPPAVASHILSEKSLKELKLPKETDGRYPIVLNAARRLSEAIGDKVALYGIICGPFTLALHLMGTEIFTKMIEEPDEIFELMEFCTEIAKDFSKMYSKTGIDIIAVVDPMTSQISPRHFKKFVKPYLTDLNRAIKVLGLKATIFCCGDATKNIELMCQTEPDGIAFDENVDLAFAKETASKYKVSFGGNMPLTTIMLFGSPVENIEEAKKELAIGKGLGYILSPG
ncbi:uroporphyrinogen decarboxylase family protein [Lutispora sp.]|uniref:uroporphyrinogen decarboxylase family protein n=1 Tax=Lutispora sp. TaxID=2828727 RepID=UPI0035667B4C